MYELQINRVSILKVVDPNILKIIFFSRLKALIDAKVFCPSFLKIWMFDLFFFFFFQRRCRVTRAAGLKNVQKPGQRICTSCAPACPL